MQPFSEFPPGEKALIKYILTDIDDTLTSDGRLPAVVFTAMERLQTAGLRIFPITGRPAGWCDLIARMWPVDGVIGENGALYYRLTEAGMVRVAHGVGRNSLASARQAGLLTFAMGVVWLILLIAVPLLVRMLSFSIWGRLVDRLGKKPVMIIVGTSALSSPIWVFS